MESTTTKKDKEHMVLPAATQEVTKDLKRFGDRIANLEKKMNKHDQESENKLEEELEKAHPKIKKLRGRNNNSFGQDL